LGKIVGFEAVFESLRLADWPKNSETHSSKVIQQNYFKNTCLI
jgi:hypothetical protein